MQKRIVTSEEARDALVQGINALANTIKATLGPKGRNVVIANEYTGPYITNDGATIAREFILEDAFCNVGIELVKEVALKTNDLAGDGTTTATLLAQKMIVEGVSYINQGYNPMSIKDTIKRAVEQAITYLQKDSEKITSIAQIRDIARISSGDIAVGEMIARAFEKLGDDALISIEETRGTTTALEIVNGYRIEEGYISPYMLNDQTKMTADLKNPYFLITNQKITSMKQIASILESLIEIQVNVVLISDTISEEVLTTLVLNKLQNVLNIVAIKAPSSHEKRKEMLEDIAVITGGKVISSELGIPLEAVTIEDLGRASQVKISKEATIIIEGRANVEQLQIKKQQIQTLLTQVTTDFEKDLLQERYAKLSKTAAVIKVGGLSELEMKEKKMKIEDALCATRVALSEGILVGGGMAYMHSASYLQTMLSSLHEEEQIGYEIVIKALQEPFMQLLRNAGIKNIKDILATLQNMDSMMGYNIRTSKIVNMKEAGIIDPFTVERVALQSASSIASLILTTESVLVDVTSESILKKGLNDQLLNDSAMGLY
jgi:chaperonin GroEL